MIQWQVQSMSRRDAVTSRSINCIYNIIYVRKKFLSNVNQPVSKMVL